MAKHTCGAVIDGPKIYRNVVAWRDYCKVPVKSQGERCRFHGKICPDCGKEMHDIPGWTHKSNECARTGDDA